ncbi:spermidine synthase [Hymenobacter rubripertinctus]|uniref:Spermine synthase n=1 Tax=Hymenobacter rubripertinctus TaxID=2029981 RepID=A0A418RAH7_9BACT|nr:fused MFS/spermidine synthase [Hymenobacter rubripertinctus]RIY14282.1 spermine synthase [Hymenobacter rubripertinctus]
MNKLLNAGRRLLSYVLPLTRRVASVHSGTLRVTLWRGHKVLDTAHANYSYGTLQRVLRYGLLFAPAHPAGPVLLLGLGGGSVVPTLRQERGVTGPITAVELDPVVIRVAAEEFGIETGPGLHIVCADAFVWVRTAPAAAFELVVVDLFLDLELPAGLGDGAFWRHLLRLTRPGGWVLCNLLTSAELWPEGQPLSGFLEQLGFEVKDVEVEQFNRLLILRKAGD